MEMPVSTLTGVTLKDLFDAGLHFGHQTKRWNPKMKSYIFDKREGIHIIDLTQTVTMLDDAAKFLQEVVLAGKKVLFVATKKQAQEIVKTAAVDCGQFYVTERWLGGTLTNNKTIRQSVKRMRTLQATGRANGGVLSVHKQEASMLRRELTKLEKNLTGVADMNEKPGAIIVVDVVREANAVKEAIRLNIPVVAITDTNADPDPIEYVIPGNDDSVRGIELVIGALAKIIKTANGEYSAKAAEAAAARQAERAAEEAKEKADRAAKREAARAAKGEKSASSRNGKNGVKKPAAVSDKVKAAAKAAKAAAEAKAIAEKAAAEVAPAADAPAAEAPAAEAPVEA